jgi:hypothetical protein
MRRSIAIAGLMAALFFGSASAFAFQETPVPPAAPGDAPQAAPPAAAPMQLGTPAGAAAPQEKQGGLNLFGYTVLPKLNFGLDVLYGQDQQKLQLGAPDSLDTLEENGDVSVLGKVKRRF